MSTNPAPEINWVELLIELESSNSSAPESNDVEADLEVGNRSLAVVHIEESALNHFGISAGSVDEILQISRGDADRMKPVCICGHGVSRHIQYSEDSAPYCSVAKGWCACKRPLPVIKVRDTRTFMHKTEGWGIKHALIKGIRAYEQKGGKISMIIEPRCIMCDRTDGMLLPAPLNRFNKIARTAQEVTIIVCENCLRENL